MSSCRCGCYDNQFDDKQARYDLKRYRKKGPDKTTRLLVDALRSEGVNGASLVDVGGGIGAVHHELLSVGASTVVHVDASAPYIRAATEEAGRRGHLERVSFRHGDFVALAPEVASADIVTLDRVICCYPDMEQLVAASASRARTLYGAVYPRDKWPIRAMFAAFNFFKRLRRDAFRIYVHPTTGIDAAVRREGLAPHTVHDTLIWRVAVYRRVNSAALSARA